MLSRRSQTSFPHTCMYSIMNCHNSITQPPSIRYQLEALVHSLWPRWWSHGDWNCMDVCSIPVGTCVFLNATNMIELYEQCVTDLKMVAYYIAAMYQWSYFDSTRGLGYTSRVAYQVTGLSASFMVLCVRTTYARVSFDVISGWTILNFKFMRFVYWSYVV